MTLPADKLDKIIEMIHRIDLNVQQNTSDLQHHIRRTDKLEERVEQTYQQLAAELAPVKSHVQRVQALGWGLVKGLALAGSILGVMKYLSLL